MEVQTEFPMEGTSSKMQEENIQQRETDQEVLKGNNPNKELSKNIKRGRKRKGLEIIPAIKNKVRKILKK